MRVYWRIFAFYFQRFIAYPWEVFALVLRRFLSIGLLIIFWMVISRTAGSAIDMRQLIAYFLIASTMSGWVMATRLNYGQFLNNLIKRGEMSTFLIRPSSVVPSTIAASFGMYGVDLLIGLVAMLVSFLILPAASFLSIILFIIYLIPALIISISLNLIIGTIAFWTIEANSFRHCLSHVARVFSGAMIPLAFFPSSLGSVVEYLPFAAMVSTPVTALRVSVLDNSVFTNMVVSISWAIVLTIISSYFWHKSLKRYEAVGI